MGAAKSAPFTLSKITMDATPNALAPLNRTQGWTTGMLLLALAATRLIAASSYMSTEPLPVATDWRTLSEDAVTYDMPAVTTFSGQPAVNTLPTLVPAR